MTKFTFTAVDNSGHRQIFTVKARDKMDAIKKGMEKARKNAKGDIYVWDCKIQNYF